MAKFGIIGGTGFYRLEGLPVIREEDVTNRYGTARVSIAQHKGCEIAFVPRHGASHSLPPHIVNYRANIKALKDLGVEYIMSTAAVGSLHMLLPPGELVLLSQFIDWTRRRIGTFFDEEDPNFRHVDVTEPFSGFLREKILKAAKDSGIHIHPYGTYVSAEGPRFETPAEISMMRLVGGDVVGMTIVPEVVLANEADIDYATVTVTTNYGAGMLPGKVRHEEVGEIFAEAKGRLERLFMATLDILVERQ